MYIVLEKSDVDSLKRKDKDKFNLLLNKIADNRKFAGKQPIEALVVDQNDPDYETFKHMAEYRREQEDHRAAMALDKVDELDNR